MYKCTYNHCEFTYVFTVTQKIVLNTLFMYLFFFFVLNHLCVMTKKSLKVMFGITSPKIKCLNGIVMKLC